MTAETSNARGEWVLVAKVKLPPDRPENDEPDAINETPFEEGYDTGWNDCLRAVRQALTAAQQPVQEGGGVCTKCRGTGEVCTGYIDGTPEMFDCTCPAAAPPSAPVGVEGFVVRHYTGDEGPTIKGNGFDGLRVGEDRNEAEEFVRWVNEALAQQPAASYCSDERPCIPCFSDCGPCEDVPAAVDEVVRAAVLAEREACAKVCDDRAAYYHAGDDDGPNTRRGIACEACASVIRWRSTVSPKFLAKHEADIEERLATQHQEPKS